MLIVASTTAVILSAFARGKAEFDERQVVAYAKGIDVALLDPTLPKQRLDDWISATMAPSEKVIWRTGDCGLKGDYPRPADGYPLCVEFVVELGDGVWGQILVGTDRRGILGEPRFKHAFVQKRRAPGSISRRSTEKLAELPRLISESK